MKRILLTLLLLLVLLGLFGAVGYTGYRLGYAQGVRTATNGDVSRLRPLAEFNPRGMYSFGMDREFQRGFGPGRFPMRGFGFFSPWRWLAPLAVLTLIVLFIYWLMTQSSWRLTRLTTEPAPPPKTENE